VSISAQIKNLSKHSSIYFISTFVQRALGFILMPVYTDTLYIASRSDYGNLNLVYTFIAFMNVVYLYGMDSALMRYFFLGKYKKEDVYKTAFITVAGGGALLSALLLLFSRPISGVVLSSPDLSYLIKITAAILFFDTLGNLPYQILRAEEKSVIFSMIRVGRFLTELALNIIFVVYLRCGITGILYANVIAAFLNLLVLLPFQTRYLKGSYNGKLLMSLLKFGLPLIPNGIAYLTVEVSDKYLMSKLLDKDTLGLYSANYKFGSALLLIIMAFRTAWQPFFLKISKEADAKQIYAVILKYFTLAGVLIVVGVSYYAGYLLKAPIFFGKPLLGQPYWAGLTVIPVILSAYLFYGLYVNFTVGIYIRKKTNLMIIFTGLAALVNIGSNLYLMPRYGIMGAAFATLLSYFVMALTIYIADHKIYPIPYEYFKIALMIVYLAAMLGLDYYYHLSIILKTILVLISPLFFVLSGILDKNEIKKIIGSLRRR
jgi:O-antigen/teichoic acid export membrane protein